MASSALFTGQLTITGDMAQQNIPLSALVNATSPVQEQLLNLASGANTLTAPTAAVATRLTIIPPAGNTVTLTLKGVSGDTGVPLHPSDPTTVGLASTVVTLVLTAGSTLNGVRIIWS